MFKEVSNDFLAGQLSQPVKLYRYDNLADRYYFERSTGGMRPYLGVTSFCHSVLPMGPGYYKWLQNTGREAEREKNIKAEFGTAFHIEAMKPFLNDPVHKGGYNFDWLDEMDGKFTNFHLLVSPEYRHMADKFRYSFKKGLLSWFNFIREKVTNVLAIEITLRSPELGLAGTLDFVHEAKFMNKNRRCITDIKSFFWDQLEDSNAKKSYFKHHELQLELCKHLWNENFPNWEATHIFNWSPKSWVKSPTYNWENQTKNEFSEEKEMFGVRLPAYKFMVASAHALGYIKPPTKVMDIQGVIDNVFEFDPTNVIKQFNI